MSEEAYLMTPRGDVCALTYTPLDVSKVMNSVASDEAGATAVFVGEPVFLLPYAIELLRMGWIRYDEEFVPRYVCFSFSLGDKY